MTSFLLAAVLVLGPGPRIDTTYPPPRDLRRPDRTNPDVEKGPVAALAYSPDGRSGATGGGARVVGLWYARTREDLTGELIRSFEGARAGISSLAFAADGQTLVAASADHAVISWEVASGKLLRSTFLAGAEQVLVRPGKEPQAAGVAGGRVRLWDHQSGAVVRTFEPAGGRVRCLAFAPDGKRLAAGGDKGLRLWDAETGALIRTVETSAVRSCAASATHLAAGYGDGTVKLWAIDSQDPPRVLKADRRPVQVVAFSAKGEQLASAAERAIAVWDVASAALLCQQEGHTAAVTAVAFNPNNQKMVSGGGDRSLRHWTVPLPPILPADLVRITSALPAKASAPRKPRKLLVLWRADAILHKGGVPAANKAIELLGKKTGAFEAHFSRDVEVLDPKVLARYDAVVFNSTAHLVIPDPAMKQALLDYVSAGGGVIGIHAAIDMFRTWPEGAKVVGATFGGHPWHPSGTWTVKLDEPDHPLLRAWGGKGFKMHDEFYELADPYLRSDRRVLMSLDLTDPPTAAATPLHRKDRDFAVSWIKRYGQGRVFYAMFGHLADPFWNPAVLQYYLDGIQYALGDLPLDEKRGPPSDAGGSPRVETRAGK